MSGAPGESGSTMHRHVYLNPLECESLARLAEEFGVDERTALTFALAAVLDTITQNQRKEDQDGTERDSR